MIWQHAICLAICQAVKAGKANQAVFLGPVVGGGRVAGSAMHLLLIRCGGRTVVLHGESVQQLTEPATAGGQWRPCARLNAQQAQQSSLPPFCSKHSVVAGRATAITADSRSLHSMHSVALSTVGEITWFEFTCANNQSQASLLLS